MLKTLPHEVVLGIFVQTLVAFKKLPYACMPSCCDTGQLCALANMYVCMCPRPTGRQVLPRVVAAGAAWRTP